MVSTKTIAENDDSNKYDSNLKIAHFLGSYGLRELVTVRAPKCRSNDNLCETSKKR